MIVSKNPDVDHLIYLREAGARGLQFSFRFSPRVRCFVFVGGREKAKEAFRFVAGRWDGRLDAGCAMLSIFQTCAVALRRGPPFVKDQLAPPPPTSCGIYRSPPSYPEEAFRR